MNNSNQAIYAINGKGSVSTDREVLVLGATDARSFGPLLQFVAGTEFASRELASYIAQRKIRH
jgi:hypothetical protein